MLKTLRRLATQLAADGWTRAEVNRFIAKIEDDGKATKKEAAAVSELLGRDGFTDGAARSARDNFVGHSRSRLKAYAGFITTVNKRTSERPGAKGASADGVRTLFAPGKPDVDVKRYRANVQVLAGERPCTVTGPDGKTRTMRLTDRFVPSKKNQLRETLSWLEGYYSKLGLKCELEPVPWRGKTLFNLVVTIPGASDESVILCDHYDVADKERIRSGKLKELKRDFHLSDAEIKKRLGTIKVGEAVPGADDNGSATAALMEMGRLAKARLGEGVKLGKTIKLVHLVGEELPADCLGGRAFLKGAKARGDKLAGVVVLDMIGIDRSGRKKMQISVGRAPGSMEVAARVKESVNDLGLDIKPVLRPFGSRKSFLHQTDALEFSKAGYPVVLLNEFLNDDWGLYASYYHSEFDVSRLMDFDFATNVTRAALETAYRLAEPRAGREV